MYVLRNNKASKVVEATFKELGMQETDVEEILRSSIDILCGDEESMLIVGKQLRNEKLGRSDLTAVDNDGNLVLIEIKRDRTDIETEKKYLSFKRFVMPLAMPPSVA